MHSFFFLGWKFYLEGSTWFFISLEQRKVTLVHKNKKRASASEVRPASERASKQAKRRRRRNEKQQQRSVHSLSDQKTLRLPWMRWMPLRVSWCTCLGIYSLAGRSGAFHFATLWLHSCPFAGSLPFLPPFLRAGALHTRPLSRSRDLLPAQSLSGSITQSRDPGGNLSTHARKFFGRLSILLRCSRYPRDQILMRRPPRAPAVREFTQHPPKVSHRSTTLFFISILACHWRGQTEFFTCRGSNEVTYVWHEFR